MPDRSLVLISCSRDKVQGGTPFDENARRLASDESLPTQRSGLLRTRGNIRDRLRGADGRLHDEDQKGGFRDEREVNRALQDGPDFAGRGACGAVYLPAYKRYNGRFFEALRAEAPNFWSELADGSIEVLIVSGLYGLVLWDEPIQNYDCHLSDSFEKLGWSRRVADLWAPVLTGMLCEFIETERAQRRPIDRIVDLLSEELYQDIFDWKRIVGKVKVHHRIFRGLSGPEALPCAARILSAYLPKLHEDSRAFKRGVRYKCAGGVGPAFEFSFEDALGSDPWATREGEILDLGVFPSLNDPELRQLPREVAEELAIAEHSWRKVGAIKRFDFGLTVVSYAKVIERWLWFALRDWRLQNTKMLQALRNSRDYRPLSEDVKMLWSLRCEGGAHPGLKRSRNDAETARSLALSILRQGEKIRLRPRGHPTMEV